MGYSRGYRSRSRGRGRLSDSTRAIYKPFGFGSYGSRTSQVKIPDGKSQASVGYPTITTTTYKPEEAAVIDILVRPSLDEPVLIFKSTPADAHLKTYYSHLLIPSSQAHYDAAVAPATSTAVNPASLTSWRAVTHAVALELLNSADQGAGKFEAVSFNGVLETPKMPMNPSYMSRPLRDIGRYIFQGKFISSERDYQTTYEDEYQDSELNGNTETEKDEEILPEASESNPTVNPSPWAQRFVNSIDPSNSALLIRIHCEAATWLDVKHILHNEAVVRSDSPLYPMMTTAPRDSSFFPACAKVNRDGACGRWGSA